MKLCDYTLFCPHFNITILVNKMVKVTANKLHCNIYSSRIRLEYRLYIVVIRKLVCTRDFDCLDFRTGCRRKNILYIKNVDRKSHNPRKATETLSTTPTDDSFINYI